MKSFYSCICLVDDLSEISQQTDAFARSHGVMAAEPASLPSQTRFSSYSSVVCKTGESPPPVAVAPMSVAKEQQQQKAGIGGGMVKDGAGGREGGSAGSNGTCGSSSGAVKLPG